VIEVVLVLLTVIAVAAAAAMAPGRLRARAARRRPPVRGPSRPASRARRATFLAVCASCLEMVETDESLVHCPACGGELAVRRRIRSSRADGLAVP
jgi:predicted RNA-binding Zn-ribbon protein involved in translation (DUF1610 family)